MGSRKAIASVSRPIESSIVEKEHTNQTKNVPVLKLDTRSSPDKAVAAPTDMAVGMKSHAVYIINIARDGRAKCQRD